MFVYENWRRINFWLSELFCVLVNVCEEGVQSTFTIDDWINLTFALSLFLHLLVHVLCSVQSRPLLSADAMMTHDPLVDSDTKEGGKVRATKPLQMDVSYSIYTKESLFEA